MGSVPSVMAENFPITSPFDAGAEDTEQSDDETAVFKPNLQNFDEARAYCYDALWLDFGSDWYERGTRPPSAESRHYNSLEYTVLDYGLIWLFGGVEALSIDEDHDDNVSQSDTTHPEDSVLSNEFWLNDKLGLRLSATEFRDWVMLADPLLGLAAAPWQQLMVIDRTSIPQNFPIPISQIIGHLPLFDTQTGHNVQQLAVDFINATFAADNPADMEILQRIGALLKLGPPDMHKDIARSFVYMLRRVRGWNSGQTFTVGEFLAFHENLYRWKSWLGSFLKDLPDDIISTALGVPLHVADLFHVLHHLQVNVGDDSNFTLTLTRCADPFFSGKPSSAKVEKFVGALPRVDVGSLADDDRDCAICRGPYGAPGSMLNGEPEGAVRLPCSHVFGELCVRVMLGPKPEGWGQRLCPVCRREVPVYPGMRPSGLRE